MAPKQAAPKPAAAPQKAAPKPAAPPKKAAPKQEAAPKAAPKPAAPPKAAPKPLKRKELIAGLAAKTELTQADVGRVLDALGELAAGELGKKGPGLFTLPMLVTLKVVKKGPTKARPGRNPHTGEPMTIPAKPARHVVKARPLKELQDRARP